MITNRSRTDLRLRRETQLRTVSVEHDVLALQENIAEDGDADAIVVLDATEADRAVVGDRGVVDEVTGDDGVVAVDSDGEGRELSVAGEDVSSELGAVLGPRYLAVVGLHDAPGQEEQGGAGV